MYPLGYATAEPQPLGVPKDQATPSKFMSDASLRLTHEQVMYIGEQVLRKAFDPQKAGRSGISRLLQRLPYLSAVNLWLVPAAHCLLLGLAKGFWNNVLAPVRHYAELAQLLTPDM